MVRDEVRKGGYVSQQLLIEYSYGWGKSFRLYNDHLEIDGTAYACNDLKTVKPTYYHFMGVPSARLVLHFQQQKVVLHGIAALDELRQAVVFLNAHCAPRSAVTRIVPIRHGYKENEPVTEYTARVSGAIKQEEFDTHQVPTIPVETPRQIASHRTLRRISMGRLLRAAQFEEEDIARRLKEGPLPVLPVPLYLLPGEYAHYTAVAARPGTKLYEYTHTYCWKDTDTSHCGTTGRNWSRWSY